MTIKVKLDVLKRNKSKMDKLWLQLLTRFVQKTNNNLYVVSKDSRFYIVAMHQHQPVLLRVPITLVEQSVFKIGNILR